MDTKKFTDVSIDGRTYNLGGYESETYLHQVAAYVNRRIAELKEQNGYVRQDAETRSVLIYLNLADDYFHKKEEAEELAARLERQEQELYALKRDMVAMKLEQERLTEKLRAAQEKERKSEQEQEIARRRSEAGAGAKEDTGHGGHI